MNDGKDYRELLETVSNVSRQIYEHTKATPFWILLTPGTLRILLEHGTGELEGWLEEGQLTEKGIEGLLGMWGGTREELLEWFNSSGSMARFTTGGGE